ncbi:hypothetical protein BDZ94DRAFT_99826 [Collybia nuda]|uniref:Secreted protein n=1 Tax=Collybia nuda TaxID=64659 RepID=A0A9P5XXG3_9AGAR|nr:hypothetical protein BDZ94DRAFT_99826 [Collybia nuda]
MFSFVFILLFLWNTTFLKSQLGTDACTCIWVNGGEFKSIRLTRFLTSNSSIGKQTLSTFSFESPMKFKYGCLPRHVSQDHLLYKSTKKLY